MLTSCQVKETKSSGGLISDNAPATNSFTLKVTNGFYNAGDNIDIKLKFPFNVIVTGTPQVSINVGGVLTTANYFSGHDTRELIFRHTIAPGENDTNGITISSPINLNSGTLTFLDSQSVVTNCALAFTTSSSSIIVDTTAPTQGSLTEPSPTLYRLGQKLTFLVNYNEVVVVTGIPRIELLVGATPKYARYASGTGTSQLKFTYTIASGDKDLDDVDIVGDNLNGGTIKDKAGNIAPFTISGSAMAGVYVHDLPTYITTSAVSANKVYILSESINFTQTFNRVMTVTGTPQIELTVGSSSVYATYLSGSGTNALVFEYVVIAPDYDSNGIVITPTVDINGGTIDDSNGDPLMLMTFTPPVTTGVKVDALVPAIASITVPTGGTYLLGQNMNFTVVFDQIVNLTGAPTLDLLIGVTTVNATYISGSGTTSLVFRYQPISGDEDSDGIDIQSLELNGGGIKSIGGNDADVTLAPTATGTVQVNAVLPLLTGFTAPADATYLLGNDMDFTVDFSKSMTVTGTPRIAFVTTNGTRYATYFSGSGTSTLIFRYTVAGGDYDYNGITITSPIALNSGTILDSFGYAAPLAFTLPDTSAVLVDTVAATITSVSVPAPKTYLNAEILPFIFSFSKSITITGTPRVALTFGATTVYADYYSGSGSPNIVFVKTVASPDSDSDGIAMQSPIQLNGGTMLDSNNIAATLSYAAPSTIGILIYSGPIVSSVTPPTNGTYLTGQNLNFVMTYNVPVTISGSPRIALDIGGTTRYATYFSGSGSTAITFRHTVVTADADSDGIQMTSPIDLNSGTILDASSGAASLTFTAPSLTAVLVDAVLPVVSSVTLPSNGVYTNASQLNFTVNFNRAITVSGTPRLVLTMGASTVYANYVSGSGSPALLFRYTLTSSSFDMDGIALGNSNNIDLNGGTLRDAVLNNSDLALGAQDLSGIIATYAGLGAWYDISTASTVTTVFSSPNYQISDWNDRSGNNRHATQTSAANRPYYLSSGYGSSNQAYANTNIATHYMNISSAIPNIQYIITVMKTPTVLATAQWFNGITSALSLTATGSLQFAPAAQWKVNGGSLNTATTATAAATVAAVTNYIISAKFASGQTVTTQRIGHATASMVNGQIAEMLFFTSSATLTNTELTVIHNYLNAKYGAY